jgi:hypothetical protein
MYEFRIGDEGNTTTVLRKKMHAKPVAAAPSMPCARSAFTAYWITIRPGNGADVATDVAMGVSSVCGTGTILHYTEPVTEPTVTTAAAADIDADATGAATGSSAVKKPVEVLPRYVSFTCLQHPAHFKSIVLKAVPASAVAVQEPQECFPRVFGRCVCMFNSLQFTDVCSRFSCVIASCAEYCRSSALASCLWLAAVQHTLVVCWCVKLQ